MSNVLRMEWFRFRKSRYTYIVFAALMALVFLGVVLDVSSNDIVAGNTTPSDKNEFQLYTGNYDEAYTSDFDEKILMLASSFSGNVIPMSVLIFTGLFAGAYQKNRFEKNIVGLMDGKFTLVGSNFVICSVYCAITILGVIIVSFIGYGLLSPDFSSLPTGSVSAFIKYVLLYYVLLDSVAIIMSCFVQTIGNQTLAIILGLVYGSGIIYGIVDFIVQVFGIYNFSIQKYVPLGNLYRLTMDNQSTYIYTFLVAIIFGIVFLVINVAVRTRQDTVT